MVILYLPKPKFDEGEKINSVSWYLSTDPTFTDDNKIVAKSEDDTVHLSGIVFNVQLDGNTDYYAMAQIKTNVQTYAPSNIAIVNVKPSIDIIRNFALPSFVSKPIFMKEEDLFGFDSEMSRYKYPNSNFKVTFSPFISNGNGIHESTTWTIKDTLGNIVYADINNKDELTNKEFTNVILETGKTYIIDAYYQSTSGDVSEAGSRYVFVPFTDWIKPKRKTFTDMPFPIEFDTSYIRTDLDTTHHLVLESIYKLASVNYIVYRKIDGMLAEIYRNNLNYTVTNSYTEADLTIPVNVLTQYTNEKEFIIGIQITNNDTLRPVKYLPLKLITKEYYTYNL